MNEEIDDSEFYHQDFTTASEWEVFIARLEEIINQWKTDDIQKDFPVESQSIWTIRSEKVTFVDFDFNLFLYRKNIEKNEASETTDDTDKQEKNPIETLYDFEYFDEKTQAEHANISTWYGLNDFFVLSPANNVGVTSESKIKILLSSVHIVASNLKCEIPIFVQIREKWQKCYLGVYEGEGVRTNFEMIHLKRSPPQCHYLTGLLDLFKGKIVSPCTLENIMVSLQHTYNLSEFGTFFWKQDIMESDNFDIENLFILPFGATVDPINTIVMKATWNRVYDTFVVDSETFSDFDPMTAHTWSCMSIMTNDPICLLGDSLTEFLQNLANSSTVYDILGDFATLPSNTDPNPLDLLTEPSVPTISSLLTRAARQSLTGSLIKRRGIPPIPESVLVPLLYFLFPDADEKTLYPYGSKEDKETTEEASENTVSVFIKLKQYFKKCFVLQVLLKNLEEDFKGFKTCGRDSLVWRLAIVLAHSLQSLGGPKAFAHIWYEFVQEMRYRWDKTMPIPG